MKQFFSFLIALALLALTGCHHLQTTPAAPAPSINPVPASRFQQTVVAPRTVPRKATPTYAVKDIGTLPGCESIYGNGINVRGEVAGDAKAQSIGRNYGFVFRRGSLRGLTSGTWTSSAKAINNRGEVTGWISLPHSPPMTSITALLYSHGRLRPLGSLGGAPESHGLGLNDRGDVVGDVTDGDVSYAFLYSHGKMRFLGKSLPEAGYDAGSAINGRGQIVGQDGIFTDKPRAVMFIRKKARRLEQGLPASFGWNLSSANAINEAGEIVGGGLHRGRSRAYLFRAGYVTDLGTLSSHQDSEAMALNNRKQAVGRSSGHAFLYTHSKMTDLNNLISTTSGWVLESANGINDKGQIVGTGKHSGKTRAFVLTPLPPTAL